jgi:hypothetical protein
MKLGEFQKKHTLPFVTSSIVRQHWSSGLFFSIFPWWWGREGATVQCDFDFLLSSHSNTLVWVEWRKNLPVVQCMCLEILWREHLSCRFYSLNFFFSEKYFIPFPGKGKVCWICGQCRKGYTCQIRKAISKVDVHQDLTLWVKRPGLV